MPAVADLAVQLCVPVSERGANRQAAVRALAEGVRRAGHMVNRIAQIAGRPGRARWASEARAHHRARSSPCRSPGCRGPRAERKTTALHDAPCNVVRTACRYATGVRAQIAVAWRERVEHRADPAPIMPRTEGAAAELGTYRRPWRRMSYSCSWFFHALVESAQKRECHVRVAPAVRGLGISASRINFSTTPLRVSPQRVAISARRAMASGERDRWTRGRLRVTAPPSQRNLRAPSLRGGLPQPCAAHGRPTLHPRAYARGHSRTGRE